MTSSDEDTDEATGLSLSPPSLDRNPLTLQAGCTGYCWVPGCFRSLKQIQTLKLQVPAQIQVPQIARLAPKRQSTQAFPPQKKGSEISHIADCNQECQLGKGTFPVSCLMHLSSVLGKDLSDLPQLGSSKSGFPQPQVHGPSAFPPNKEQGIFKSLSPWASLGTLR